MADQRAEISRLILIHAKGGVTSQERQQKEDGAGRRAECCLLDITQQSYLELVTVELPAQDQACQRA